MLVVLLVVLCGMMAQQNAWKGPLAEFSLNRDKISANIQIWTYKYIVRNDFWNSVIPKQKFHSFIFWGWPHLGKHSGISTFFLPNYFGHVGKFWVIFRWFKGFFRAMFKITIVLGIGKTPHPPCWEKFPNNPVFLFWVLTLENREYLQFMLVSLRTGCMFV